MKVIITKYHGATNTRGSRFTARAEGVKSVSIPYDYSLNSWGNHAKVAKKLKDKMGWYGEMVSGCLPSGEEVFVFTKSDKIN